MAQGGHADYDRARSSYPEIDKLAAQDWVEFFQANPDVFHRLLGEVYIITKTRDAVGKKSGRRSRYINGNLDELWSLLSPRYATVPFSAAVREIMGRESLRSFASRIPMHHHSLTRLMRGERQVVNNGDPVSSMRLLERIARAGGVHPAFFAEWRTLYVTHAIGAVLQENPNVSISLMGMLADARRA